VSKEEIQRQGENKRQSGGILSSYYWGLLNFNNWIKAPVGFRFFHYFVFLQKMWELVGS